MSIAYRGLRSREGRCKNAKVLSERSVNMQAAIGDEKPSKRARR
jgi:hypothetical protein